MRAQVSRTRQVLQPDVEFVKGLNGTLAALTKSDTVEGDVAFGPDELHDFLKDVTRRFISCRKNTQADLYDLLHGGVKGEA